jgi:hypothetical protein
MSAALREDMLSQRAKKPGVNQKGQTPKHTNAQIIESTHLELSKHHVTFRVVSESDDGKCCASFGRLCIQKRRGTKIDERVCDLQAYSSLLLLVGRLGPGPGGKS